MFAVEGAASPEKILGPHRAGLSGPWQRIVNLTLLEAARLGMTHLVQHSNVLIYHQKRQWDAPHCA